MTMKADVLVVFTQWSNGRNNACPQQQHPVPYHDSITLPEALDSRHFQRVTLPLSVSLALSCYVWAFNSWELTGAIKL